MVSREHYKVRVSSIIKAVCEPSESNTSSSQGIFGHIFVKCRCYKMRSGVSQSDPLILAMSTINLISIRGKLRCVLEISSYLVQGATRGGLGGSVPDS